MEVKDDVLIGFILDGTIVPEKTIEYKGKVMTITNFKKNKNLSLSYLNNDGEPRKVTFLGKNHPSS